MRLVILRNISPLWVAEKELTNFFLYLALAPLESLLPFSVPGGISYYSRRSDGWKSMQKLETQYSFVSSTSN